MRALVVTEAGEAWPSGYVRALIYRDLFRRAGIEAEFVHRRSERLVRVLERPVAGGKNPFSSGARRGAEFLNRVATHYGNAETLRLAERCDVVYLQKVLSWPVVEALRRKVKARLVYDLNDAVWMPSFGPEMKEDVDRILAAVDAVTCDNPYGLDYARRFNSACFLVPDPCQVEAFDAIRADAARTEPPVALGWIGSEGTCGHLKRIQGPLERLFATRFDVTLRVVGASRSAVSFLRAGGARVSALSSYSREAMMREALGMHIGLFPLYDTEEARVRGVLKAAVYMSAGACVVASPVGQNRDLIRHGVNGFLAESDEEYLDCLEALVDDAGLRARIAAAGLETVRAEFSLERCFARLLEALRAPGAAT